MERSDEYLLAVVDVRSDDEDGDSRNATIEIGGTYVPPAARSAVTQAAAAAIISWSRAFSTRGHQ